MLSGMLSGLLSGMLGQIEQLMTMLDKPPNNRTNADLQELQVQCPPDQVH